MRRVVCPGSFDPVTNGHLDIVSRAARLLRRGRRRGAAQPRQDRAVHASTSGWRCCARSPGIDNVRVAKFDGLIVDFCKANDISAIVKGLRAVSDFDYELQMAQMNYSLAGVETLFMTDQPALRVPVLQPGQGVRQVRRRRHQPGAGAGARPADRPPGRVVTGVRPGGRPAEPAGLGFSQAARYADRPIPRQHLCLPCHIANPRNSKRLILRMPLVFDTRTLGPGSRASMTARPRLRLILVSSWSTFQKGPTSSWMFSLRASPKACW